jgi:hypothetical protein
VSLLFRDELRVMLSPGRLQLARAERALTRHGVTRGAATRKTISCDEAGGESPWSVVLEKLHEELPALATGRVRTTVVLSSRFVRYAVLPWSDALIDHAEEAAYAKHCFRQRYGAAADGWEMRLQPERVGIPRLACAVDIRLLDALRTLFAATGIRLDSIQPDLMWVFNHCRRKVRERSGWFVLAEAGYLCVALVHDARWQAARTMRIDGDWRDALPAILEREAFLAESPGDSDVVFLGAEKPAIGELRTDREWQIHELFTLMPQELASDYEEFIAAEGSP